jgi:radical SAM protein with 4Fe4S-binding SPASM domain
MSDRSLDDLLSDRPALVYDRLEHYRRGGPTSEFTSLPETKPDIRNIGWTLGNDCPYRCKHCYSMNARLKGRDVSAAMVDRVVEQLASNGIETVNLGGNEPLFTNGPKPGNTILPYIIQRLVEAGITVGLTTSGITILRLYSNHRPAFELLNDVDVSIDSPFEDEHNQNRGARIYGQAIDALWICQQNDKPHTCIMAAMNWNFTRRHIIALVQLAEQYGAFVRINPVKPVEPAHMSVALPWTMYYEGFSLLNSLCDTIELGEPPLAAVGGAGTGRRCPCGRTSFRIHSITPDGKIPVSPCVYLHDYKSEFDLLQHDLSEIINSPQFRVFRQRHANPGEIVGCRGCDLLESCGGGCAARSYLYHAHAHAGAKTMRARDPYCPREHGVTDFAEIQHLSHRHTLVHMDYLCTWIGSPRASKPR